MYKQSDYNFVYDDLGADKVLLYNSRTGALAMLQEAQHLQFQQFITDGTEIKDADFLSNLLTCGYIVPKDVDEKFLIKAQMLEGRYNSQALSLTIAPTMACNFRCVYCFEQGHYGNAIMDQATANAVIDFVKKNSNHIKLLHVTWFGGEPLIGLSVIEQLTREFVAFCQSKDITYHASIVTNGYLLTRDVAERLQACFVQSAQITVDGPRDVHNARRPLANGGGNYDTIIKNLSAAKDFLQITVRVNVDTDNMEDAKKVMADLRGAGLLPGIQVYPGLVISYDNKYNGDKCLSDEAYSKYNLRFLLENQLPVQKIYPVPKRNYCGADHNRSWVIDDVGNLYKCWNDIGIPEKSVGNICTKGSCLSSTALIERYGSFDPMNNTDCSDCKMLPICLGGCPRNALDGERRCEYRKYAMHEYLLECAKHILAQPKHQTQSN